MTGHTSLTTRADHGEPPLWALTDYEITRALAAVPEDQRAALHAEQESRRHLRAAIRPAHDIDDD